MRTLIQLTACLSLLCFACAARADDDIIEKTPPKSAKVLGEVPAAGAASELDSLPGRRYALLVGVNDYTYFSDLTFCDADINNLSKVLTHSGFDARDLIVLRDGLTDHHLLPYRNNILTQFKNLLESVRPNDLVLVAFSGHGVHLDGKSYLCPSDSQLDRAGETMIPLDKLYDMLQACPASQKLLIVDACRNDPTPSGTRAPSSIGETNEFTRSLQQQAPPRGTMLFNSCAPNQFSVEDPTFKSGVFMHYVIEGLKGQADADKDDKVSLFELYRYAEYETKTHVRRTRNLVQTPVLKGEVTGVYELATVSDVAIEPTKVEMTPAAKPEPTDVASTVSGAEGTKSAKSTAAAANGFGVAVDEAAQNKALIERHPLLKQGNLFFAAGKYDDAINTFTNVIKVEENKAVIREAFKRRSASYMAADPSGNVLKALADTQAAGRTALTVQVRSSDAKLMDGSTVVAQLRNGQSVEIASSNGAWLQVISVDGNDSLLGWIETKNLAAEQPVVVAAPQQTFSQPTQNFPQQNFPQQTRPRPQHGNGGGNGNGGMSGREAVIRGIEQKIIRSILK